MRRQGVPGLSGDKIRTFCRKNRQLDAPRRRLWTPFLVPELLDTATCSNSRGGHDRGDLHRPPVIAIGPWRRPERANTPNLRITPRTLSILDPYPTYN
jgi:hypothetical protein